jgi:hypothetical protein
MRPNRARDIHSQNVIRGGQMIVHGRSAVCANSRTAGAPHRIREYPSRFKEDEPSL